MASIEDILDKNSIPEPNSGCWIWLRGVGGRNGYAVWIWEGRQRRASHLALMLKGIEVTEGFDACHHCDNPTCVNPDHIFVGTRTDNMQDAKRKGRTRGAPQKLFCSNGHKMAPPNMYVDESGRRRCRACGEMHSREQDAKKKIARHQRGLKRFDERWGNT